MGSFERFEPNNAEDKETPPPQSEAERINEDIEEVFADRARQRAVKELFGGAAATLFGENRVLADQATKDVLTGLDNRRSFLEKAAGIVTGIAPKGAEGQRKAEVEHMTIGIFDADFFKNVNDAYGHDAGDEVLRAIAEHLKKLVRGRDVVARWGGEEFTIAFEHADEKTILRRLGFDPTQKKPAQIIIRKISVNGGTVDITLSGGITEYRAGESVGDAIDRADKALYYSKEHGRNQVRAFEDIENRETG